MAFDKAYGTYPSGSFVGNREDLSDETSVIEALDLAFLPLIGKETAENTLFSWTVDKNRDPRSEGVKEGEGVSNFASQHSDLGRVYNFTQHFRDTGLVSKVQNAIRGVTPVDLAHAQLKAEENVARDVEYTYLLPAQGARDDDGVNSRLTRSLGYFATVAPTADDLNAIPSAYKIPAASIDALGDINEGTLFDVISSMFKQSGKSVDYHCIATQALRKKCIETLTRLDSTATAVRYPNGNGSSVTFDVEVFYTPSGALKLFNGNPDCFAGGTVEGYIFDPSMISEKVLIPMGVEEIDTGGAGPGFLVEKVSGLCVKNPLGLGKITTS